MEPMGIGASMTRTGYFSAFFTGFEKASLYGFYDDRGPDNRIAPGGILQNSLTT